MKNPVFREQKGSSKITTVRAMDILGAGDTYMTYARRGRGFGQNKMK